MASDPFMPRLPFFAVFAICSTFAVAADWTALPDGGQPLLPPDSINSLRLSASGGLASAGRIAVSDMPFTEAMRVNVNRPGTNLWDAQVLGRTSGDVKQGDLLLLCVYARGASSESGMEEASATAYLQHNSGGFEKLISLPFTGSSEW